MTFTTKKYTANATHSIERDSESIGNGPQRAKRVSTADLTPFVHSFIASQISFLAIRQSAAEDVVEKAAPKTLCNLLFSPKISLRDFWTFSEIPVHPKQLNTESGNDRNSIFKKKTQYYRQYHGKMFVHQCCLHFRRSHCTSDSF